MKMMKTDEIKLELTDNEWQFDYADHDREIVRGIVFDSEYNFYFVRADRDDIFAKAVVIETAGGGVETGEDLKTAIKRELLEETGAVAEKITYLGRLDTTPALIRERIHMDLAEGLTFGERKLDADEFINVELVPLTDSIAAKLSEIGLTLKAQ